MNIKEITKDFKSFTDWIYQEVTDKNAEAITDEEALELDSRGFALIQEKGIDMIMAKASKISSLNILDKNVNFKVFENLPKIWFAYQNAAEAATKQVKE